MGTKCKIAYQGSESVEVITCYNDGAFDKIGYKLLNIYNKEKYIQMIMNRGNLEVLGENLRKYATDNKKGTVDVYQSQKKKEKYKNYKDISDLLQQTTDSQYMYYFKDNTWYGMEVAEDEGKLKPYLSEFVRLDTLLA